MNDPSGRLRRRVRGALWITAASSALAFSATALAQAPPARALPPLPASAPSSSATVSASADPAPPAPSAGPSPDAAPSSSTDVDILMPSSPPDAAPSATGTFRAAHTVVAAPVASGGGTAKPSFVPPPAKFTLDPSLAAMTDDAHAKEDAKGDFTPAMQVGFHAFFWPYFVSAIAGGVALDGKTKSNLDDLGWLLLPCLGPFLSTIAMNDHLDDAARGTLLADGIVQSVGLTTFIIAASFRHPKPPPQEVAKRGLTLQLAPGPGNGLGIRGSF